MKIALIADTFPPLRTSGAIQLRDLSRELVRQGCEITVILPAANLVQLWLLEEIAGVRILRLKAPSIKDVNYIRRTIGEFLMPFAMRRNFRRSPFFHEAWDGIIWYSPSIFHAPFVSFLKKFNRCKGYLIIRDIFPEWAVDMGLIKRGLPYLFFKAVARYQYSVADIIGIQSISNQTYFDHWKKKSGRTLEVLANWMDNASKVSCSIQISKTILAGRKIFVYTGNMGVAQGLNIFLELAEKLQYRSDVGFLFVGRGSEVQRLRAIACGSRLSNTLFFDEIDPEEISDLYAQCHIGIVALDHRHKSHNIPGKFLAYMQSGLPVLANINAGNDLAKMIRTDRVGFVCESNRIDELLELAREMLFEIQNESEFSSRCHQLFRRSFSVKRAASQVISALLG